MVLSGTASTTAVLLNTCSYPSGEPNSDPSDCVVIPGKAHPSVATSLKLIPEDSATLSNNVGTRGSVTFELYQDLGNEGDCDATELVFSYTDSSSPYASVNSGDPAVNSGYSITTADEYLCRG